MDEDINRIPQISESTEQELKIQNCLWLPSYFLGNRLTPLLDSCADSQAGLSKKAILIPSILHMISEPRVPSWLMLHVSVVATPAEK
jgi:hypothetical protein